MMGFSKKHYYKGISLFIKISILIISLIYIVNKINTSNVFSVFYKEQLRWEFFLVALFLVIINWGIEAYKWQFLIQRIEKISFLKAFQSVLSGVTIGVFTPNRVGEFAGRVFYLDPINKQDGYRVQATLISIVGSAFQLLVTLLIGFAAVFYIANNSEQVKQSLLEVFTSNYFLIGISIIVLVVVAIVLFKKQLIKKYKKHMQVFFSYSCKELFHVFYLSLFRYIVFAIQYYLILKCLNIDLEFFLTFNLVALTFIMSAIIPTFVFTEIAVRGASAIYFFSFYLSDTSLVFAASFMVWLINLALPSLIGALYIWNLKFFKEQN